MPTEPDARAAGNPSTTQEGTMTYRLATTAARHLPERAEVPALTSGGTTRTYEQLEDRTDRLAAGLAGLGVGDGDRVGVLDKNSAETMEVVIAAAKLGAVAVPLNWRLAVPELQQVIDDASAPVVVAHEEFGDAARSLQGPRAVLEVGGDASYERLIADHEPLGSPVTGDDDTVVLQLYTSGTTGAPKGVMLDNRNLQALTKVGGAWGVDETSVVLCAMPMFHIAGSGMTLIGLATGCHTVIVREVDPAALLDLMVDERVTNTFLVPAVIQMLCEVPGAADRDLSALRSIAYGASPITPTALRRAIEVLGRPLFQLYGLTETTGAIVQLDADDHDPDGPRSHLLNAAGRPYPWVELRIVDLEGNDLPTGESGEILVRSTQTTPGYFNRPDATAEAIDADGWFHTGDIGHLDAGGYLYIDDRLKDMIITGGENVYPTEVEAALAEHPAVAEVAVIGVPDERWGETVKALVVTRAGHDVDEQELLDHTRERIAGYKRPRELEIVDALPYSSTGKLLKRVLREPASGDAPT